VADLAATFRKPFAEQVAAFRLRLGDLVPTSRWDDISRHQHDRAFMVAGALKADLLADLAAAVDKAISQGTTLDEFRRDFRALVEKNGWHGWTGEGTAKGEAWRTKVIYRTNLATSYAAGRRAQLVEGDYAFWVYRHGGSLEPRLHHLAWDGVALPPDHPFWATHSPPNGWGCSCRVFGARSEAGIKRVGGIPGKELPDDWLSADPRTGAPKGIDKGWDYAPGASATGDINAALTAKQGKLPAPLAQGLRQTASTVAPTDAAVVADLLSRLIGSDGLQIAAMIRARAASLVEDRLDLGQKMALHAYTMGPFYGPLTSYQRLRAKGLIAPDPDQEALGAAIDAALVRLPTVSGLFTRGVPAPSERMMSFFLDVPIGTQFSFEGITSSSMDPEKAFKGPLRFIIQGLTGRQINHLSDLDKQEEEVLLRRGLQFRVLARTYANEVVTLWIEELRPHSWRDLPREAMHSEVLG
jgi:hypothetical protein